MDSRTSSTRRRPHPERPATTVVVPTIGRRSELRQTVNAVLDCDPAPHEVIVVDQSPQPGDLLGTDLRRRVRVIPDRGRGAARARNEGARAASNELLLFADDDCVPHRDWVARAQELHTVHPDAILTGSVLPGGEIDGVPSTRNDPAPIDHSGTIVCAALYSGNMAVSRRALLDFGGFDERFPTAGGEDNDLCYRWLRAGRELRYEPALVVVHLDWRTPEQQREVWAEYGRTQGMFYAKLLRSGDLNALRFLVGDVLGLARARIAGAPARSPDVPALGPALRSIVRNWSRFA
jgi:GT2 family glycosyltransferase